MGSVYADVKAACSIDHLLDNQLDDKFGHTTAAHIDPASKHGVTGSCNKAFKKKETFRQQQGIEEEEEFAGLSDSSHRSSSGLSLL